MELIISLVLQSSSDINYRGLRLIDLLLLILVIISLISYRDGYKNKFDLKFWLLCLVRIFYIIFMLFIFDTKDLRQYLSIGYFIEFLAVVFLLNFNKFDFEKLWKIGIVLAFANNFLAICQFVIYKKGYGSIGSELTCFALPFIIYGIVFYNKVTFKYKILTVLCILGALVSQQRTLLAIIGLGITLCFIYILFLKKEYKYLKNIASTMMIFFLIWIFVPQELKDIILSKFNEIFQGSGTLNTRYVLWDTATDIFRENPLFGIGSGSFQRLSLEEFFTYTAMNLNPYYVGLSTHNLFLEYLSELGIMGTFLTYAVVFYLIRKAIIFQKNSEKVDNRFYCLLISFFTLTIYDFFGQGTFFSFWIYSYLLLFSYIKNNE